MNKNFIKKLVKMKKNADGHKCQHCGERVTMREGMPCVVDTFTKHVCVAPGSLEEFMKRHQHDFLIKDKHEKS